MPETTLNLDPIATHEPREIDDQEHDAAILAPVVERDGEQHLLFTRRADHLGEHPGQMSFPGGGAEPIDDSILETALREANEEIGLESDEAEVVGQLDDIRTVSEYAVTPFVARVPDCEYDRDDDEVAEIVFLPLSGLLDPTNYEYERRDHPYYGDIVIHYFHVDGYTVWGATGRILVQLLELSTGFEPPERVDRV
ncbi:NUDIX hydrolase [Natronobacterium gregoryi]|uniref:ADP-ribose pyrophosphatase n=2 Tax=Natronobacterium gregoryi TaxID=44930 RepID=L0AD56_NATGS|nr:CoA pyrophosphatase [Natronobacterium gregoryi]AFZ71833.1 ADP-ribose pyrophosphatase [Natronobacterium gregoryi SP2]ELY72993.1 NUDIX hydrolase [Natronobacterium gregoryi SP2]PLK19135.1 CoA pyrophosphatase [Natronobacterium gregoryi SP2]SFJ60327.1 ADP-ribose pyrophosphatase YjhB, NUDIX family [Natronobacterium gregoryi]